MKKILNFKNQEYEKEIENLLKFEEDKDLLYEYLLFINYEKWININIENYINDNNLFFFQELKKYKIYSDKDIFNNRIFKIIFHIYLFLLIKIEDAIKILANINDKLETKIKIKEINESIHILSHLFILIEKLYIKNIYNFKKLLLFLDVLAFFINKSDNINNKFQKIKNIILFELLFDFYGKISNILLKGNINKEDILYFFYYLEKYLNRNEVKSIFNKSILTNNKIIKKFIHTMLNNFDYSKMMHEDIYKISKTSIIESFSNIYERNTNQSKFFEILINQNKKSFTNLYNFINEKDNIIKDIYIQNFYIELLNKLFEKEKKNKKVQDDKICPPRNSFIYNGYNSKMTFKLNNFSINNLIIFFSFQISDEINNKATNLPLLILENHSHDILFKLYIMHMINNETNKAYNKLYVHQQKKNDKSKNDFILDNIEDIIPNSNYYIAIYFMNKKICINLKRVNINNEKDYHQEIDTNIIIKDLKIILKLGHLVEKDEYFKGYIGSFTIFKNLQKDINHEEVINTILKLKDYYTYFPYLICKSTKYNFENLKNFYPEEYDKLIKIKKYVQKNIKQFECIFYLSPDIINLYSSLIEKKFKFDYMPVIPDICESQNFHIVLEMNISLTKFDSINADFLKNNGLDYICLIFEYFY